LPRSGAAVADDMRGIDMPHLYGVLGIAADADNIRVKAAFRRLAKTCHPDLRGGNEARFKEIAQAYATLTDPAKRAAYDAQCAQVRADMRRRLAGAITTMATSFALTVGSGVTVAGWLLGA
jgi:DnaJ-class molecular chaperone